MKLYNMFRFSGYRVSELGEVCKILRTSYTSLVEQEDNGGYVLVNNEGDMEYISMQTLMVLSGLPYNPDMITIRPRVLRDKTQLNKLRDLEDRQLEKDNDFAW